ncbi:MAG: rhomboid family intramembrane serine protease [Lachnospiraceae bacterium]|nr:rhomboid family intramembrane serine protease [Lachnospiraceae bacterium]
MEKRNIRITFNAPVILVFSLLCFLATLAGILTGGRSTSLIFTVYRAPVSPLAVLRLITHVFGHTGWAHLVGNLSFVLLVGPMLEEKYGHLRIALILLITAVVTGLINIIFFPTVALCGASGVVFALILLSSFSGYREKGEIPITFILVAVLFLGKEIYQGVVVDDNISNLAHVIGGVIGSIGGFLLTRKKYEELAESQAKARADERAASPLFAPEEIERRAAKERGERGIFGRRKAEEAVPAAGAVLADEDPFAGLRPASVTGVEPAAPEHTAPDPALPEAAPAFTADTEASEIAASAASVPVPEAAPAAEEDAPSFDELFPDLKTSND